jgi:YD repeat-containing protein
MKSQEDDFLSSPDQRYSRRTRLEHAMKKLMIAILLAGVAATAAHAQQTTFRDAGGRAIGTATRNSEGTTTFRDARGRTTGTATRDGQGTTVYRDARGRTIGRSGR